MRLPGAFLDTSLRLPGNQGIFPLYEVTRCFPRHLFEVTRCLGVVGVNLSKRFFLFMRLPGVTRRFPGQVKTKHSKAPGNLKEVSKTSLVVLERRSGLGLGLSDLFGAGFEASSAGEFSQTISGWSCSSPRPISGLVLGLSWFWWSPSHFWAGFGEIGFGIEIVQGLGPKKF